jgi:hypothetical protein
VETKECGPWVQNSTFRMRICISGKSQACTHLTKSLCQKETQRIVGKHVEETSMRKHMYKENTYLEMIKINI